MFHIPHYFSPEELAQLQAAEGGLLHRVLYTIWRNLANPDGPMEVLEWVELDLGERPGLTFTTSPEGEGLVLRPLDFGAEKAQVEAQFGGQVQLDRVDMSSAPPWAQLMGMPLGSVALSSPLDGHFENSQVQLNFGSATVELAQNVEGLLVRAV